jgi:hypothetical protein
MPVRRRRFPAAAMIELIQQPEKRRQFGNAAHASFIQRGMTGQAMAANYEKIYQRVLPKHA